MVVDAVRTVGALRTHGVQKDAAACEVAKALRRPQFLGTSHEGDWAWRDLRLIRNLSKRCTGRRERIRGSAEPEGPSVL